MMFDRKLCINLLAEFAASSMFMSLGCLASEGSYGYHDSSFSFGFSMVIIYQCFRHSSGGHANPCVTCAAIILNKIKWTHGLFYMLMHFLGTIFGFLIAYLVVPRSDYLERNSQFCCVTTKHDISIVGAFTIEFVCTCAYIYAWCAALDNRNEYRKDTMALRLGLALAAVTSFSNIYTGCSANVFRPILPALASEHFDKLWIFVAAPIGPSIGIPLLWRYLLTTDVDADVGTKHEKSKSILGEIK